MFFKKGRLWGKANASEAHSTTNLRAGDGLDLGFYGDWYGDLAGLQDSQLARHWEQHGAREGRHPNFASLLRAEELPQDLLPPQFTAKVHAALNPGLTSLPYWEACLAILRQDPIRPCLVSSSCQENAAFYTALADFHARHGAQDKATALEEVAARFHGAATDDAAAVAQTFGQSTAAQEPASQEPLDPEFYQAWHADLAGLDETRLRKHWEQFGQREKRAPNFTALLAANGLSYADIPPDFDPEDYLLLNPSVRGEGVQNRFAAMLHYLEHGLARKLEYLFDPDFYAGYNEDIGKTVRDRASAREHWSRNGIQEGRHPNIRACLRALKLEEAPVPPSLTPENYAVLNPSLAHFNFWKALLVILQQSPPSPYRVGETDAETMQFYTDLGCYYARSGKDELAIELFRMACLFGFSPSALEHLGNHALREKKIAKASALYRQAIASGEVTFWVHHNLVNSLMELGDIASAMEATRDYLRAFPGLHTAIASMETVVKQYWDQAYDRLTGLASANAREEVLRQALQAVGTVAEVYEAAALSASDVPARASVNRKRVLIIGDFFLPQCKRYRIMQKVEQLELAGFEVVALPWNQAKPIEKELLFHDIIIFYRVPAFPNLIRAMVTARALGKLTIYEIDDLIFDPKAFPPPIDTYGGSLNPGQYANLLMAMVLTRTAAMQCDYGLASTPPLAEHLARLVRRNRCLVHRNALDSENETFFPGRPVQREGGINIFYGSGTLAHNSDFLEEALPALDRILQEREQVTLTIVGHLRLPATFLQRHRHRVEQLPLMQNLHSYWRVLAQADINLAVLSDDDFNGCKSELKWFEAGFLGIPSVVSYTKTYAGVIRSMEDGIIAHGPDAFYAGLLRLVDDAAFRTAMGQAAKARVREEYSLEAMARNISAVLDEMLDDFEQVAKERREVAVDAQA